VPLLVALLIAAVVAVVAPDDPRHTADGVYTRAQADAGRDAFLMACVSCHTPTQHGGPEFIAKWHGRTLGELFIYLKAEMPKTDPGTMSDEEYVQLTAYLMRINRMPTGPRPLAVDSAALHRIRIDSVPSAPAR
jgi:mono/diheme cytochrome c family protein